MVAEHERLVKLLDIRMNQYQLNPTVYVVTIQNTWDSYNSVIIFKNKNKALKYAHENYLVMKDGDETDEFNPEGFYKSGDSDTSIVIKMYQTVLNIDSDIIFESTLDN